MRFLGSTCLFALSIITVVLCFFLGIVTLFVSFDIYVDDAAAWNVYKTTSWSRAKIIDGKHPISELDGRFCNARRMESFATTRGEDYNVMVAMVAIGFGFTTLLMFLTPCLLIGKLTDGGGSACLGVIGFLAWLFYLVAWTYWLAKPNACKTLADNDPNYEHNYYTGWICCVTLWGMLTLALPCICGGSWVQRKKGKY